MPLVSSSINRRKANPIEARSSIFVNFDHVTRYRYGRVKER